MKTMTYVEAIRTAMDEAMGKDSSVFLAGEDVGKVGGPFGASRGLYKKYGADRVLDTPISETAIIGLGVGSAMTGMRPVVELMYMDFMGVCLDEIMNQAAKMRYMFGGEAKVPMVIRMPAGATVRAAAQHSQSLEAMVCHIPGLKVVYPSTPQDAYSLLGEAIKDDNPVVYIEHKAMYTTSGEVDTSKEIKIGKASVLTEGNDATVVAWGLMARIAEDAAKELKKEGINIEVIDPRTLVPLDKEAIYQSVKKTGRLVIVQEAVRTGGFASEISACAAEECIGYLDAPIVRVTAPDTPVPYSPILEDEFVPDKNKIITAVKSIL